MGSIGIVWEYLIQYGKTKTGMVTKLPISNTKFADKYCSSSLSKQCSGQIMSTGNTRVPHDAKCYIYKVITCKESIYKMGQQSMPNSRPGVFYILQTWVI